MLDNETPAGDAAGAHEDVCNADVDGGFVALAEGNAKTAYVPVPFSREAYNNYCHSRRCVPSEQHFQMIQNAIVWMTPPRPDEIDQENVADTWAIQNRITWAAYEARCELADKVPTLSEFHDHVARSNEEIARIEDAVAAHRVIRAEELCNYFGIREFAGAPVICKITRDGKTAMRTAAAFKAGHVDKVVEIETRDKSGNTIISQVSAADHFLKNYCTWYDSAEFRPGVAQKDMPERVYNLWRGWPATLLHGMDARKIDKHGACEMVVDHHGVATYRMPLVPCHDDVLDGEEPPWASCGKFLHHMLHAMCGGDRELFRYFLDWMSSAILNPGKSRVAIVLRGEEGAGKGFWAKRFMEFFAPYTFTVKDPRHVVGNFNAHLQTALVILCDEAFFTEDKRHVGALKVLTTDEEILIEAKFGTPFMAPRFFVLILSTNEEHVIMAGLKDRRNLVLNVDAGAHTDDEAHFAAIDAEWRGGGRWALFRWLTGRSQRERVGEGRFQKMKRPVTAALNKQKDLSLRGADGAVHNMLHEGDPGCLCVREGREDGTWLFVPTKLLAEAHRADPKQITRLGKHLRDVTGEANADRPYINGVQYKGYWLPPLAECRARWEEILGREVEWPEMADGWGDPPAEPKAPRHPGEQGAPPF